MKRIWIVTLLVALVLTGCASPAEDPHPDWDESWVRIGEFAGVEPLEGFTLNESNDVMAIAGLYYATWTTGEEKAFTNADGEDALIYDAQIYVLLEQCRDPEEARDEVGKWIAREKQNFETGPVEQETVGDQEFQLLPLLSGSQTNPYSHGTAAFACRGEWAISVELVCAGDYTEDSRAVLEQFLAGFHF